MKVDIPIVSSSADVVHARGGSSFRVSSNLNLVVSRSFRGKWFVDEPITGEFGVGDSPQEAVADLIATLSGYVDALRKRRYQLAPQLRSHLSWLENQIA